MQPYILRKINYFAVGICAAIACGIFFPYAFSRAQTNTLAQAVSDRQAALAAELAQVEKDIAAQQVILDGKQAQGASIQRDIDILTAKINKAKLEIRAHNLTIQSLGKDINVKTSTINSMQAKIDSSLESLSDLVRKTYQMDSSGLSLMVLSNKSLSDFFIDIDSYNAINRAIGDSLDSIRTDKTEVETEKDALSKKQNAEIDARKAIEADQRTVQKSEQEKQKLLSLNKKEQKSYQDYLATQRQKAAEIRSALFSLRDSAPIPFGDALNFANAAYQSTNVRPAFLLAILTQESNLGANTGSCYLTNALTGDGVGAKSGRVIAKVMSPTRDVPIFLELLKGIGRDPYKTLVSCPQEIGWGGAMGPAQFIPSTWSLMQKAVARALGKLVPDPWEPKDAIVASAVFLQGLGADDGGYTAEREAACRYYSGRACSKSSGAANYGNSVMKKAQNIQENMIDPLKVL